MICLRGVFASASQLREMFVRSLDADSNRKYDFSFFALLVSSFVASMNINNNNINNNNKKEKARKVHEFRRRGAKPNAPKPFLLLN